MISIKVQDGTRQTTAHKCLTCQNAVVIKGTCESNDRTVCQLVGSVRQAVTDCSAYAAVELAGALRTFKGIAYQLSTDCEGNIFWEDPTGKVIKNGKVQRKIARIRRRMRTITNPVKTLVN